MRKHPRARQAPRSVRRALEFRDPSWLCPKVFAILQRYQVVLCIHALIKNHPRFLPRLGPIYDIMAITMRAVYSRQKLAAAANATSKTLFRLAALTLQCAGLTTLESSSASEPGRNILGCKHRTVAAVPTGWLHPIST